MFCSWKFPKSKFVTANHFWPAVFQITRQTLRHCCFLNKTSSGGAFTGGHEDIWPRLPVPHYHEVLALKGLRPTKTLYGLSLLIYCLPEASSLKSPKLQQGTNLWDRFTKSSSFASQMGHEWIVWVTVTSRVHSTPKTCVLIDRLIQTSKGQPVWILSLPCSQHHNIEEQNTHQTRERQCSDHDRTNKRWKLDPVPFRSFCSHGVDAQRWDYL